MPVQLGDRETIALNVMLIDASTGLVQAIRLVSLHPSTARTIVAAIEHQARTPWDHRRHDATIARVYQRPSEDLAKRCEMRPAGIVREAH